MPTTLADLKASLERFAERYDAYLAKSKGLTHAEDFEAFRQFRRDFESDPAISDALLEAQLRRRWGR